MPRPLRLSLLLLCLLLLCCAGAAFLYTFWPLESTILQTTLVPTFLPRP